LKKDPENDFKLFFHTEVQIPIEKVSICEQEKSFGQNRTGLADSQFEALGLELHKETYL